MLLGCYRPQACVNGRTIMTSRMPCTRSISSLTALLSAHAGAAVDSKEQPSKLFTKCMSLCRVKVTSSEGVTDWSQRHGLLPLRILRSRRRVPVECKRRGSCRNKFVPARMEVADFCRIRCTGRTRQGQGNAPRSGALQSLAHGRLSVRHGALPRDGDGYASRLLLYDERTTRSHMCTVLAALVTLCTHVAVESAGCLQESQRVSFRMANAPSWQKRGSPPRT